jgi:hypothetical protein
MTASRIFTYTITFFGGAAITVSAANKTTACRNAVDFHGGDQFVDITKIERYMPTGGYRVAALPRRTRSFAADAEAPL